MHLCTRQIEISYTPESLPTLKDFTLDLTPGAFVGVVGPNGSGKSTLVRTLSRTLRPVRGAVLLDDINLYTQMSARASARRIGVVPQSATIAFDFTVREVVRMGRAPHLPSRPFAAETAADENIVIDSLRAADVLNLADRIVTTLSGGEQQRVLLARALAQQPEIILMDEPTSHLDIRHQTQVLTLARSLAHDQGKAVLAVLHDLNLAASYCDTLVLMHRGRIVAQGVPQETLTAENVHQIYGARVWVRSHPASGRPFLLSLPDTLEAEAAETLSGRETETIHVLCGGGTGAGLLITLKQRGFTVTSGGLNAGDTDQEAAEMLGIPYARESPFTALSETTIDEALRLGREADIVVVTEAPYGKGNLGNLESALALRRTGKPVFCLATPGSDFASRDFTEGAATEVWNKLLAAGAQIIPDSESLIVALSQETSSLD